MAEEYRYLMAYGERVGRSHGTKTPCQDKALCIQRDGVNVAVLSDGCGSAPLSQYGSKLTVEAVGNFLADNFDDLVANGFLENANANLDTRKRLVKQIVDTELNAIENDPEMHEVFYKYKEEHMDHFNNYTSRHSEECYWLSLMHATLVFFAEKNGKAIFGQIGDGFLGLLASGKMRIFIEEDKIPGAKNATCYPDNIYEFALTRAEKDDWYFFRSFKMGIASSEHIEGVMLTSDGVDSFFDKSVRFQMKYAQNAVTGLFNRIQNAESFEERQEIINELYLPKLVAGSSTFDDCSIALLITPDAKIEECVAKVYPHDEEDEQVLKDRMSPEEVKKPEPTKEDPTKREVDVVKKVSNAEVEELEKKYIALADKADAGRIHEDVVLAIKQKVLELNFEKYLEAFYEEYIEFLETLVSKGYVSYANNRVDHPSVPEDVKRYLAKKKIPYKIILEAENGYLYLERKEFRIYVKK